MVKLNPYDIESESCPNCDVAGELTYVANCKAFHCGDCGEWISLEGEILEGE